WLGAPKNLVDIVDGAATQRKEVDTIRQQTPVSDIFIGRVQRWQAARCRELDNARPVRKVHTIVRYHYGFDAVLLQLSEGRLDLHRISRFAYFDFQSQSVCRRFNRL